MLQFFRKHQKLFFAVTALFVIVSFSFFGTAPAMGGGEGKEKDRVIGHAIDGSKMRQREIAELIRFISYDAFDFPIFNPCNDGVIKKDFFEGGLGAVLIDHYFDLIRDELADRFAWQKRYALYVHPQIPTISTEQTWRQMAPHMLDQVKSYQARAEMNPEAAKALIELCATQQQFPPHVLYNMLRYQEKQFGAASSDPYLSYNDLSLFGARSISDIFGPTFIELIAQTIHNGAKYAEQLGYKVTLAEARADMLAHGHNTLRLRGESGELDGFLRAIGVEQKRAEKVWQKIVLFRRYINDKGHSVLVDPLTYKTLHAFAGKRVDLDCYELPAALALTEKKDELRLQAYIDALSADTSEALPSKFVSTVPPELLQKRFLIEVQSVLVEDIAIGIGLKEMWEWQSKPSNVERLKKEFPELRSSKGGLDALATDVRARVDHFSRCALAALRFDLIDDALDNAAVEKKVLHILESERTELSKLLEAAPLPSEKMLSDAQLIARDKLRRYSPDGKTYLRIALIDKSDGPEVLTFAEALNSGALDKRLPGSATVKDRIAKHLELCRAQAREGTLEVAESDGAEEHVLPPREPLSAQWRLVKTHKSLTRKAFDTAFAESVLDEAVGTWGKMATGFYCVRDVGEGADDLSEEMQAGQKLLGIEAKQAALTSLVALMQEKGATHIAKSE